MCVRVCVAGVIILFILGIALLLCAVIVAVGILVVRRFVLVHI